MATENSSTTVIPSPALLTGLAMVGGLGLTAMILAGGFGVLVGTPENSNALWLVFLGGLGLLVAAIAAWAAVVRPFDHFDDINQPAPSDHGHGHDAHAADDHAHSEAAH